MFKFLMIFVIFVALFTWEASKLVRKKEKKELIVFSLLTLIGLVLSILVVIQAFI